MATIPSSQWGFTTTACDDVKYTWTITNFSQRREVTGEKLTSPAFYSGENLEDQWCLDVYPKGNTEQNKDDVSLFLRLINSKKSELKILYSLSVLSSKTNEKVNIHQSERKYQPEASRGWANFIKGSELKIYMVNDTIKFCCEINMPIRTVHNSSIECPIESIDFADTTGQLAQDFWGLFKDSKFSDVVIIVKGQHFHVHRLILSARSPVFAAMFEHKTMEESQKSRIEIEDMDPEIVQKMLQFLYTDKIDNFEDIASEMLVPADKYELTGLRTACEQILSKHLIVDNAAEILILADRHNSKKLLISTVKFICRNMVEVLKTLGYRRLEDEHPVLLKYLVGVFAMQVTQKVEDIE